MRPCACPVDPGRLRSLKRKAKMEIALMRKLNLTHVSRIQTAAATACIAMKQCVCPAVLGKLTSLRRNTKMVIAKVEKA